MTTTSDTPIFFIGGAPRAGTTVTHALICTSEKTNDYRGEISFVTPLLQSYVLGLTNWDAHTCNYFAEKEHFRLHMKKLVDQTFDSIGASLGTPEILSVKDPLLTPYFGRMRELLGARAKFITVVRHPYDVLRSRQAVAEKGEPPFNEEVVRRLSQQYLTSYYHLQSPLLKDCLMYFYYEDLEKEETHKALGQFVGTQDLSVAALWQRTKEEGAGEKSDGAGDTDKAAAQTDDAGVWNSPKYNKPIDLSSRLSPLEDKYRVIVDRVCGAFMKKHNYVPIKA